VVAQLFETPRLQLRRVRLSDAAFFVRLLNEPSWLENIGDRGIRSDADAESYIRGSILAQYRTYGYGMYAIQLKSSEAPIGICGLVKREFLGAPDIGFALLQDHAGEGFAAEAARGVMLYAQGALGIGQVYAIVKPGNARSIRLLDRLEFRCKGPYVLPQGAEVLLYVTDAATVR
jgi:RimJ/RimL family protein N-acetyltransferase